MKIVNRSTFLALPAGTVFAKYQPCVFGDLMIKGDTCTGGNDFLYQEIVDAIDCDNSDEFGDLLDEAAATGKSIALDFHCEGRDGLFDLDELYAVWERQDVLQLVSRLLETLKQTEVQG